MWFVKCEKAERQLLLCKSKEGLRSKGWTGAIPTHAPLNPLFLIIESIFSVQFLLKGKKMNKGTVTVVAYEYIIM